VASKARSDLEDAEISSTSSERLEEAGEVDLAALETIDRRLYATARRQGVRRTRSRS